MGHHVLIAWIREEITSTMVVIRNEVVGYEETLEPNPEMGVSEGTFYPTTGDRQYIIVEKPIYGDVPRTVLNERRASHAAEALVTLILSDEECLYLAEELMGGHEVFVRYWERLSRQGRDKRTRSVALRHLGRAPSQLFVKGLKRVLESVRGPLEFLSQFCVGVCFYAWLIWLIWPHSKAGMWIAAVVKRILAEAKRIIYD